MMTFSDKLRSNDQPKRLAVKLNATGEQYVLKGHPWVFSKAIKKINKGGHAGDLAIIFGGKSNGMVGIGLYDPESPIRIKILYHGNDPVVINKDFFRRKIEDAFEKRKPLLKTNTNSYRLIFGENDGLPGFIADVYANVLVVKLYSEIWLPYLEIMIPGLQEITDCQTIVLRLSRQLLQSDSHHFVDGEVIYGALENEVVKFVEHGVNFSAHVIKGHKTGYFLDHRANRKQVGGWSRGKTVLDVFSYAGGFSVHALAGGAKEVTSLDISKQALDIAYKNGKLNDYSGTHELIAGDAFEALKKLIKDQKTFDVVVIDPPSFAKQTSEITLAKKKYAKLAELGEKLTAKNGLLVLASCSSRVTAQAFFDINKEQLRQGHRKYHLILQTGHDVDHPVSFSEGAYLKCGYYRFKD
ncbi:class I SAM-dependent rRNA methyltransferase [Gaetbulibacter aestuarii]|uniref:Class I SAM-dependent rRNA methyltransferase n=1 Tax=Gaetbulibacter aestuarii TaxID=1502358 RepID=A0ABW7N147_9FLAO